GSGSDHTVFLNFIGMPVIGLGFEGDYGVYHSAYDDFFWMNHFGDPGYKYHTLMTQLWGVTALRLANADVLPFDFATYAANIRQFVKDLEKANEANIRARAPSTVQASEARPPSSSNDVILNGGKAAVKDPTKSGRTNAASGAESGTVNFTDILKAIDN